MVVKYFSNIRGFTKTKEAKVDPCETVEELLKMLCCQYGKKFESKVFVEGELSSEIIILVNGRHILHCDGIDTRLSENDEISIFPVVGGG